jgi:hypothetical protein
MIVYIIFELLRNSSVPNLENRRSSLLNITNGYKKSTMASTINFERSLSDIARVLLYSNFGLSIRTGMRY